MKKAISKTVFVLGLVSFLNELPSQIVVPFVSDENKGAAPGVESGAASDPQEELYESNLCEVT